MRSINLLLLFGIRRNYLRSGRSQSLCLSIRRVIKQIVVIIGPFYFCQLCTKFYPTSCCQGYSILTYSMEQSPSSETNWFAASQEIPRILWNPKVYYCIHKCPPPVSIMSQLDPVHTPTSHFLKIHLNIILPFVSGSPQRSLSFMFPHQNSVHTSPLPHMRHMPCPSHSS